MSIRFKCDLCGKLDVLNDQKDISDWVAIFDPNSQKMMYYCCANCLNKLKSQSQKGEQYGLSA